MDKTGNKRWDLEWVGEAKGIHIDWVEADRYQVENGIGLFHSLLPEHGATLVASVPADKVIVTLNTYLNHDKQIQKQDQKRC